MALSSSWFRIHGSQPCDRGSNPLGATNEKLLQKILYLFSYWWVSNCVARLAGVPLAMVGICHSNVVHRLDFTKRKLQNYSRICTDS